MKTKEKIIKQIKTILDEWGGFTAGEIDLVSSPVYNSFGKDEFQLVEGFYLDGVNVNTYIHENNINDFFVNYEDLDIFLLEEILGIAQVYEINQIENGINKYDYKF